MTRRKLEPQLSEDITISKGRRRIATTGIIDTGANASQVKRSIACRLTPSIGAPTALGVTNAGDVGGNVVEVRLRIGSRTQTVRAFVPAVVFMPDGTTQKIDGKNLVGLDFLRGTKSVLDFSKPRGQELQGFKDLDFGNILRIRPMTAREKALTAHVTCAVPPKRSRRR